MNTNGHDEWEHKSDLNLNLNVSHTDCTDDTDVHTLGEMNNALVGWKALGLAILKASFQSGRPQNLLRLTATAVCLFISPPTQRFKFRFDLI